MTRKTQSQKIRSVIEEVNGSFGTLGISTDACVISGRDRKGLEILFVGEGLDEVPWMRRQRVAWAAVARYPDLFRKVVRVLVLTPREYQGYDAVDRGLPN
jgi:hypothetical protein